MNALHLFSLLNYAHNYARASCVELAPLVFNGAYIVATTSVKQATGTACTHQNVCQPVTILRHHPEFLTVLGSRRLECSDLPKQLGEVDIVGVCRGFFRFTAPNKSNKH